MREPVKNAAWTALVYSALTAARARAAIKARLTRWEKKRAEDRLRRRIASVWDALG